MTVLHASVLILILIFPSVVLGQRISIDAGVDAGIPLAKSVQNPGPPITFAPAAPATVERPPFVAGPALQFNLGSEFSIEADTLYRPVRFQTKEMFPNFIRMQSITAYSIEVPVVGQFTFGSAKFRPTAGVGFVVYDKLWGALDSYGFISTGQQTHVRSPYRPDDSSSAPPLVTTAGFSWMHSGFRLNPQLRYSRWAGNNVRKRNEWDILLGFTLPVFHHR